MQYIFQAVSYSEIREYLNYLYSLSFTIDKDILHYGVFKK